MSKNDSVNSNGPRTSKPARVLLNKIGTFKGCFKVAAANAVGATLADELLHKRLDEYKIHTRTIEMISSRKVIEKLLADGWHEVAQKGSHKQFKHPKKPGRVTVPHPYKDMKRGTLNSIEKRSGVKLS